MVKAELAHGCTKASDKDAIVNQYIPLVNQIAKRYGRFRPDLIEDLVQVGAIGLLKAIHYYDPDRARVASFRTVASCYIKGEIRHYLRDHSLLVQVPRKLSEINAQVCQLEETLSRELGRAPSLTELSKRSGYTVEEICDAQRSWDACVHYESFDARGDQEEKDDTRALLEVVADRKYQDFQLAAEDHELIVQALKNLGEKTRQIVEFVYFYDLTQKETAQELGISEMGVSRTIRRALVKLKDILTTEIL